MDNEEASCVSGVVKNLRQKQKMDCCRVSSNNIYTLFFMRMFNISLRLNIHNFFHFET